MRSCWRARYGSASAPTGALPRRERPARPAIATAMPPDMPASPAQARSNTSLRWRPGARIGLRTCALSRPRRLTSWSAVSREGGHPSACPGSLRDPLAIACWRLRIARRIGVVLRQPCDQIPAHEWLQVCFKGVRFLLGVDLSAPDIKSKGFEVLCPLLRVLDGGLGPFVKRMALGPMPFSFGDVICKGIKLAFHGRVMLFENA